jgi:hypothetical protein
MGVVPVTLTVVVVLVLLILLVSGKNRQTRELSPPQNPKAFPFSEIANDPNFQLVDTICTKIRGVSKKNYDGSSRQQIIRTLCHAGDALYLIREPNNPVDPNAVQVRRIVCGVDRPRMGEQLGYLSSLLAQDLAPLLDGGIVMFAKILNVTGEDKDTEGVNIEIEQYKRVP